MRNYYNLSSYYSFCVDTWYNDAKAKWKVTFITVFLNFLVELGEFRKYSILNIYNRFLYIHACIRRRTRSWSLLRWRRTREHHIIFMAQLIASVLYVLLCAIMPTSSITTEAAIYDAPWYTAGMMKRKL